MTIRPLPLEAVRELALLPHAVLNRSVAQLTHVVAARAEIGRDDLDEYEGAAFTLDDGLAFALRHYRGHPAGTSTVYLPQQLSDVAEITRILADIMGQLGLTRDAVLWQRADGPDL